MPCGKWKKEFNDRLREVVEAQIKINMGVTYGIQTDYKTRAEGERQTTKLDPTKKSVATFYNGMNQLDEISEEKKRKA